MRIKALQTYRHYWISLGVLLLSACTAPNEPSASITEHTQHAEIQIEIATNQGHMVVALDPNAAPLSVANFLEYVDAGFYDNLIFHRVISDFMIQGGGFDASFQRQTTRQPIPNESDNGLSNVRGTIAMARTQDPHSATSQFYINLVDNPGLDARGRQAGYAVFGELSSGFEVLDAIGSVPTQTQSTPIGTMADVPTTAVLIHHIRRID